MSRHVVSAKPNNTIAEVAWLMADHNVSAIPVCDDDGTLRGMISEEDLLRRHGKAQGLQHPWWLGVLAGDDQLIQALARHLQLEQHRVRGLMTAPVISVAGDVNRAQIIDLLLRYRTCTGRAGRQSRRHRQPRQSYSRLVPQPRALQEFQHPRLRVSGAQLG
jgi:CBS-domain-containing membrane protein